MSDSVGLLLAAVEQAKYFVDLIPKRGDIDKTHWHPGGIGNDLAQAVHLARWLGGRVTLQFDSPDFDLSDPLSQHRGFAMGISLPAQYAESAEDITVMDCGELHSVVWSFKMALAKRVAERVGEREARDNTFGDVILGALVVGPAEDTKEVS